MARVALLGLPYDAASSFRRGAAKAPDLIREALLSPAGNEWSESGIAISRVLDDRGNLELPENRDVNDAIARAVAEVVRGDGRPLLLGGDHSVTYGVLRGVGRRHAGLTIVQIDAHPDLYDEFEGNRFSHACPFARIMEEELAAKLIQIGIRATTQHQREQATRFGVDTIDMGRWQGGDRPRTTGPVYLSLDVDGIDPAHAPGVSHPEPGGLTVREVITIIHELGPSLVGADVVEYNPDADVNGATARVAAKLVKEIVGAMAGGD